MTTIVTGGSNGLGREIISTIDDKEVYNLDIIAPEEVLWNETYMECDVCDVDAVQEIVSSINIVDVLINNAGVNHIAWLEDETLSNWEKLINTNARAIFLTTQAALPQLTASKGTILNIVSNASHMAMTTSLAYNASKGAAHIMTLQLARELTKKNGITVFGISPAKIEGTLMSEYIDQTVPEMRGWTPKQSRQYQLNGLVTGEEIPAQSIAEFIAYLLESKENHKHFSGCIIPYGA